ncbi:MAG: hypothetical protein H6772_01650 [Pseudomonadales bacterium]|nr:hypothetical protein [Pseudomonadales bacterium]
MKEKNVIHIYFERDEESLKINLSNQPLYKYFAIDDDFIDLESEFDFKGS